jgi:hypothetical protein
MSERARPAPTMSERARPAPTMTERARPVPTMSNFALVLGSRGEFERRFEFPSPHRCWRRR